MEETDEDIIKLWEKNDYYWNNDCRERFIVPKDKVKDFLNKFPPLEDDKERKTYLVLTNATLLKEISEIDNDYIGFEVCVMDDYLNINMNVLYEAINEEGWDYEKC